MDNFSENKEGTLIKKNKLYSNPVKYVLSIDRLHIKYINKGDSSFHRGNFNTARACCEKVLSIEIIQFDFYCWISNDTWKFIF